MQRILQDWAVIGTGSFTARVWNQDGQIAGFVTVTAPGGTAAFIKDCVWSGATYSEDYVGLQVVQVTGTLYVAPVATASVLTTSSGEALAAGFNIGAVALVPGQSEAEFGGGGGGGAAVWGDITGTLADQTDLQAALDAKAASVHTHVAADISNSTTAGRALLTAADAAAQRTALGLGSLATASSVTASQISDSTTAGRALLTAVDAAAQRTALGLGSLATASTVTASQISDSTSAGRALLTAANVAAQQTALGLGALALLSTVGTSQIDNDAVTYAKIQNVSATSRFLGRNTSGAGDVEEVTLTQALDWIGSPARGDILYRGASNWAKLAAGTTGQKLKTTGSSGDPVWVDDVATISFVIDGGGAAITTGVKGDLEIPFGCTIVGWTLLADTSTTTTLDIWKDTYANYPPVVGDSITASAKPGMSAATKGQSSTLTGWTTAIAAGDTLRFNVDANNNATRLTLSIKVVKT